MLGLMIQEPKKMVVKKPVYEPSNWMG